MTEQNLFNSEAETPSVNEQQQQSPAPQQASIPPELVDWVGEGKKYSSIDEVYKAFPHSQNHIITLSNKVTELEEEVARRKSAEDVLNEIRNRETVQQKPTSQGVEVNQSVLSEMVGKEVAAQKGREIAKANLDIFKKSFTDIWGDKAEEQYAKLSKETGFSFDELNGLAAKSPQAVMKMAGLQKPVHPTKLDSSVNTQALINQSKEGETLDSKVSPSASSKQLADGWRRAGEIVNRKLQG